MEITIMELNSYNAFAPTSPLLPPTALTTHNHVDVLKGTIVNENDCLNYWTNLLNSKETPSFLIRDSDEDFFRLTLTGELVISSPIAAKTLVKAIASSPCLYAVESIRLNHVKFSPEALIAFAKELSFLRKLSCVEFENIDFSEIRLLDFLMECDPNKHKIENLEFHQITLDKYLINDLKDYMKDNENLTSLDFFSINNNTTSLKNLFDSLITHPKFEYLSLKFFTLKPDEISSLGSLVAVCPQFYYLDLKAIHNDKEQLEPIYSGLKTRSFFYPKHYVQFNDPKESSINNHGVANIEENPLNQKTPEFSSIQNSGEMVEIGRLLMGDLDTKPEVCYEYWLNRLNNPATTLCEKNDEDKNILSLGSGEQEPLILHSTVATQQLIRAIESQNIILDGILFDNCIVSSESLKAFSTLFNTQNQLKKISLHNSASPLNINELDSEKRLCELEFCNCLLETELITYLRDYCKGHPNIVSFNLTECERDTDPSSSLSPIISSLATCALQNLSFSYTHLNCDEIGILSELIADQILLKTIDLSKINLTSQTLHFITIALQKQYQNLKSLDCLEQGTLSINLSYNEIDDKSILDFFKTINTVRELILNGTRIKSWTIPIIAATKNILTFLELDLLSIPLEDEGRRIVQFIRNKKKLPLPPVRDLKTIAFTITPHQRQSAFIKACLSYIENCGYQCTVAELQTGVEFSPNCNISEIKSYVGIIPPSYNEIQMKIYQGEITTEVFQEILSIEDSAVRKALFLNFLEKQGLKTSYQESNGNCFFESLIKCLMNGNSTIQNEVHFGQALRAKIVEELRTNPDIYSPYIDWECHSSFDSHCDSMAKDRIWAGAVEVRAAAEVLSKWLGVNCYLHVYGFDNFKPGFEEVIENGLIKTRSELIYGPSNPNTSKGNRIFYLFNTQNPIHYQPMIKLDKQKSTKREFDQAFSSIDLLGEDEISRKNKTAKARLR